MIIYLAGKITGDSNYKEKFKRYELYYGLQGYTVLNPAVLPESEELTWQDYMDICKVMLSKADTIAMLPDYKDSKGALQELQWAVEQGKNIIFQKQHIFRYPHCQEIDTYGKCETCKHYQPLIKPLSNQLYIFNRGACIKNGRKYAQRTESCTSWRHYNETSNTI